MALDTEENRSTLISLFHNLESDTNFSVQSPRSQEYNCIAWAMGFTDRWVDCSGEDGIHKIWWPDGVDSDRRPETLISAFTCLGFELCGSCEVETGYDKVALYQSQYENPLTGVVEDKIVWTHAARIVENNKFHSKIGNLFDIFHSDGDVFADSSYGRVYAYMRRREEGRCITAEIMNRPTKLNPPEDLRRLADFYFGVL